ncbi:uncharacterized protein LOC118460499 [Anopheles albimanus]|uniref:HTH OST-type domain-containing protein n=1 Tax=Anopheles albimanus TaxID=7167 RepID=A0A8W7K8N1_ANOAL|nr:uncharacterized protein LOC118460499 [Anopheles albimanus]
MEKEMEKELATVKRRLRALLISSGKSRMSLKELAEEFYQGEGEKIPYAQFGFRTVLDFARSISDVLQLHGRPGDQDALVSVVSDASVSHVQHLVGLNKKNNKPKKRVVTTQKSWNYVNVCKQLNNQTVKQNKTPPNPGGKTYHHPTTATPYKYHKKQQHQYAGSTMKANTVPTPTKLSPVHYRISHLIPQEISLDWINCLNLPPEVMGLGWRIENPQIEHFFKPNTKQSVNVLSLVNPNRLWITTSSLQGAHNRMSKDLQSCYSDPASANRWDFHPDHVCYGLYCAAHWREKWHRAQIVGPLQVGSQLVKLRFIDHGRTELVHLSSIKYLVKSFQTFPASAVRASLAFVIPREHYWNRDHVYRLYSLLLPHASFTASIVDANPSTQVLDIILYGPKETQNINHLFAKSVNGKWKNKKPEMIDIVQYRNRVKGYSESHPSFLDIEEGRYPAVSELERSFARGFDFDHHYAQCVHNESVNQKIFEQHKLTLERIIHKYVRSATNPFTSYSS